MNNLIYGLHGFLGTGSDWNQSTQLLTQENLVVTPSYLSDPKFKSLSLNVFYNDIQSYFRPEIKRKIFIGYSLGGRIGLELLSRYPNLFEHWIFISTHPGLIEDHEKNKRIENDEIWSDKIKKIGDNYSWNEFLKDWNQQPVLSESKNNFSNLENLLIESLVSALNIYSLGRQFDKRDVLKSNEKKVTWVNGELDQKFLSLSNELEQNKILLNYKRIFGGHRLLIDNPNEIRALLQEVLQQSS